MKNINNLLKKRKFKRVTEKDIIEAYDRYFSYGKESYFSVLSRIWGGYDKKINFEPNLYWGVNPMDYDTMYDYLDALREKWKKEFDPDDKYWSVSVDDFDSFEEYLNAIKEKKSWKIKYDSKNQFDVNPFEFHDLDDYLDALREKWFEKCDPTYYHPDVSVYDFDSFEEYVMTTKQAVIDEKKSWEEKYNSKNQFDVDPFEFYDLDEYLNALREEWREKCDSDDKYWSVSVYDFDSFEEYEKSYKLAIKGEKESWREKYDSKNQFYVNPLNFDDLDDYLAVLREKWRLRCDPDDKYCNISVYDFDSFEEYAKSIKQATKNKKNTMGKEKKIAYSNFTKFSFLFQNINIKFRGIFKHSKSSFIIDLLVDNQNVFPIGLSLCDLTIDGKQVDLKNNDLIVYSESIEGSIDSGCFEFNPNDFEYTETTTIHTLQFNLDIDKLILSRETFINTKITLNFQ